MTSINDCQRQYQNVHGCKCLKKKQFNYFAKNKLDSIIFRIEICFVRAPVRPQNRQVICVTVRLNEIRVTNKRKREWTLTTFIVLKSNDSCNYSRLRRFSSDSFFEVFFFSLFWFSKKKSKSRFVQNAKRFGQEF